MDPYISLGYRHAEALRVMENIQVGESTALVGVGSCGKSRFMRFLAERSVRSHYLRPPWISALFILVNGDDLVAYQEDLIYELLLRRLFETVTHELRAQPDSHILRQAHAGFQEMLSGPTGGTRRVFGSVVDWLRAQGVNLVFLLDDWDEAIRRGQPETFAGLRALRDAHKFHLVYILAGRRELNELREPAPKFETFAELFPHTNTLFLGPYNPQDATLMLTELSQRYRFDLSEQRGERLRSASGGHAGLLRAAFQAALEIPTPYNWGNLVNRLYESRDVAQECHKIVDSLQSAERQTLETLSLGLADPLKATDSLRARGLVVPYGSGHYQVFSPLLSYYVAQHTNRRPLPPYEEF